MYNQFINIFRVLGPENKYKVLKILTILLATIFFDFLSIGLLLPILTLLFDENKSENYEILVTTKEYFQFDVNLILFSVIIFFFAIVTKVILLLLFEYKSQQYNRDFAINISMKAYSHFLYLPWYKILNLDHSYIMRVIYDSHVVVSNGIMQYLNLFKNFLFLSLVIVYLFFVNLKITFTILIILLLLTFILFVAFKKNFSSLSEKKASAEKFRLKNISESMLSLRDIKLNGNPNYFLDLYRGNEEIDKKIQVSYSVLSKIPRSLFEVTTVLFLVIIVFYLKPDQNMLKELIPIFGLYGIVILRLIPLFTQINQNIQTLLLSKVQVLEVIKNINEKNINKSEIKSEKFLDFNNKIDNIDKIEIQNLNFYYNDANYILKDVNLDLEKNKTFYIEGKNGSGKSTLVDLISGMLKPTKGLIKINGKDINNSSLLWKKNIGYVSQLTFLINESIKENIIFGRDYINERMINKVVDLTGLTELINELPEKINTNVGNLGTKLSGGQKQKIMIARALIDDPGLIIFDESTNALDFESEKNFLEIINKIKKNRIIIFIAHSELIKNFCDKKFLITNKTIKEI